MKTKLIIVLICLITLTSCANANKCSLDKISNVSITSSSTTLPDVAIINNNDYELFITELTDYKNNFRTLFTDKKILREDTNIFGESTEGGIGTEYKDEQGNIIRYRKILYGELGKCEINYYIFGEDKYYCTWLQSNCSRYIFSPDLDMDILDYNFKQYYVCNDKYYIINDISEELIPINEMPISAYNDYLED